MSSLIETLKLDTLTARKSNDEVRKSLLVTLLSEAEKVGKDAANRTSSDDEVISTIRKFLKNAEQTVEILKTGGRDTAVVDAEIAILQGYLPKLMAEADLEAAIAEIIGRLPDRSPKAMGAVMADLKATRGGSYDGKMASAVTRRLLS